MKKRLLSILLCIVVIICMMPATALANSMSWKWTVTVFGGNYFSVDGIASSTNMYTINRHLDNSKDHEIGYAFEWNASAGGSTYDGGWQLVLTVDGSVVERSTAYIYTRNMSTASGSWTAPKSSHTGPSSHPFTIFLSDYEKGNYEKEQNYILSYDANGGIDAPAAQTISSKTGSATFTIASQEPSRDGYDFKGWSEKRNGKTDYQPGGTITINRNTTLYAVWGKNHCQDEEYTVTYKDGCNGEVFADDVHSNLAKDAKTPEFRGTANREGYIFKGWEPDVADTVTRNATYVAQWEKEAPAIVTPDKPTGEDLNGILGDKIVTVKCINANAAHNPKMLTYGLIDNGYTIGDVQKAADNSYVCDVMFSASAYQAKYNDDTNSKHSLAPETQAQNDAFVRLTWNQALNKWTAQNDSNVVFTVACEEQHIEELYTVTYTDGVDNEEVFADQVFRNIKKGEKTPEFNGTPSRTGYEFAGWTPKKADTVTENIVYSATWSKKGTGGGGTVTYYTVKWNNYDNTTLETDYCYYGQLPKYDGTTPVKPADEKYTYEFTGWDKEIVKVTGNAVYTAQFKAIEKENPADPTNPDPTKPNPTKPDPAEPTRPEQPDPTKPAKPCRPDTEVPKTGDTAADAVLVNTFVLMLSALGGTVLWHRRKQKNQISK